MRFLAFLWALFVCFMIGFFIAAQLRKTEWARRRHTQAHKWYCDVTGGVPLPSEDGWHFVCLYKVNKKGELIRP
jgi:hypothetical protein